MTFYNLAQMTTSTIGSGTITLNAAVSGFLTFDQAGVPNSGTVSYGILDTASSEVGTGVYVNTPIKRLTRNVVNSTSSNLPISLSGNARVYVTPLASDLNPELPTSSTQYYVATYSGSAWTSGPVTSNSIASGTINTGRLADNIITSAKIVDGTIIGADIASLTLTGGATGNLVSGTITTANLGDNSVTGAKIIDGTITTTDIASLTLTGGATGNLASGTITTANLADNSVTTGKILDGTILNADVSSGTLTTSRLADATVTYPKLAITGSILNADLVSGTITTSRLADNSVSTGKIIDGTITTADVASLTLTGGATGNLASGTITTANLADNSVTGAKIIDGTVLNADLASGTLTTSRLADNAVTGPKISGYPADSTKFLAGDGTWGSAAWTTYTPTWTAVSVNPVLNNGTINARYIQIGKLVICQGSITMGSSTTYGTGIWALTLPVTASSTPPVYTGGSPVLIQDSSLSAYYLVTAYRDSTTAMSIMLNQLALDWVKESVPFTWAQNDVLRWFLIYEAA